jgi:F-type H+-transporting ATPase subunit gamma
VERRLRHLGELREILGSMKSLAFMQAQRLERGRAARAALAASLDRAAAALVAWYPEAVPAPAPGPPAWVVLGAERGFCGDLNGALAARLAAEAGAEPSGPVIAVGRRLRDLLADQGVHVVGVPGADMVEALDGVLEGVAEALAARQAPAALGLLYHDPEAEAVTLRPLIPPFPRPAAGGAPAGSPPVLNMPPRDLARALEEQLVLTRLQGALHDALLAESRRRVSHLDGAVRHLDRRIDALRRRGNALRQEEIIEEIEVLLLSAGGRGEPRVPHEESGSRNAVHCASEAVDPLEPPG